MSINGVANDYSKKTYGVHKVIFLYWSVLVIWQNIRGTTNRSGVDVIVKLGLIVVLVVFFLYRSKKINSRNLIITMIFGICIVINIMVSNTSLSLSNAVSYLFPVLLAFLCFCLGNNYQINKKELFWFLDFLIITVLYMAIYSFIFCTDQFRNALSVSNAYGNELTSFLISNHEYGMYITFAIAGCIIGLELGDKNNKNKKTFYFISLIVFFPNLLLTYSRTAIFSCLIMLIIYCVFNPKSKIKIILILTGIVVITIIIFSETIRSYIYSIVLKENTDSGRGSLLETGMQIFKESSGLNKIFGNGYENTSKLIQIYTGHGSLHNAYLQVLVTNGAVGLLFLIFMILNNIKQNIKIYNKNEFLSVIFTGLTFSCMMFMLTNTSILFYSPIDSFCLTAVAVIIPKYVRNSLAAGNFDEDSENAIIVERYL